VGMVVKDSLATQLGGNESMVINNNADSNMSNFKASQIGAHRRHMKTMSNRGNHDCKHQHHGPPKKLRRGKEQKEFSVSNARMQPTVCQCFKIPQSGYSRNVLSSEQTYGGSGKMKKILFMVRSIEILAK
jgi:hypothetical protein